MQPSPAWPVAGSRFYDVSMPITPGMPVYRNRDEKRPAFSVTRDFGPEGGVRESRVCLDTHTGTHVDAPLHVIPGAPGVESIPLAVLTGPCRVLDLTGVVERIEAADLAPHRIGPGDFVLLKTRNSFQDGFRPDFVYLGAGAARFLAERRVRGVGSDGLGIERDQPGHPTHRALLEEGIAVLEGLRLGAVPPGRYVLVALPLPLQGVDAAPARVVLLADGGGRQEFYDPVPNLQVHKATYERWGCPPAAG